MAIYTDWYEWTENFMNTFLARLKDAIDNDATIQVYTPTVVIVTDEDLERNDINAKLDKSMFIIHTPIEGNAMGVLGQGREDVILTCTITAVARSGKGIVGNKEIPLVGDATATRPGVLEMQADLRSLLFAGGIYNRLASGGVDYLWEIVIGPTDEPLADRDEIGEIRSCSRLVTGHKEAVMWS